MSHWTKSKVVLKDLFVLKQVAEKNGVKVAQATKSNKIKFSSRWAGDLDAEMVLTKNGGQAGVVAHENGNKGEFALTMDNYGNSLSAEFGNDCEKLMQGYTVAIVEQQAMLMGGTMTGRTVLEDGSIELHIGLS